MPHSLPKAPFHEPDRPHDADLKDEIWLCFWAMIGCLAIGSAGWLYHRVQGDETHLTAFLVVAGFYGLMAVTRVIKLVMGHHHVGSGGH